MRALRGGDILVVEADPSFVSGIGSALKAAGHEVTTSGAVAQAKNTLERVSFDLVLCGESLPDGSGAGLCSWIKRNPEYAELNRVSVGLLVGGGRSAAQIEVARPDEVLPSVGRKGLLGGLFGASRAVAPRSIDEARLQSVVSPQSSPAVAAVGSAAAGQDVAPDDVIGKAMPMPEILARVQILLRLKRYLDEINNTVTTLMAVAEGIEEQDRRARGHCKRLALMAVELGSVVGCDEWQLTTLERAAYLHDIGKVSIPGALISKPDTLSPRELEIIHSHCALGEALCRPVAALKPVLPVIRHHHEKSNGTGYPDGLRGEDIPVLAQILSIPDIYDALRMWRPYRMPMTEGQAIALMQQEVNQGFWNRQIFEAFVNHVLPGLEERLDSYHVLWPPLVTA